MSGLFRMSKPDGPVHAPDKDDERQRLAALAEIQKTGGSASTLLTKGLSSPVARTNAVSAPKTTMTAGL